MAKTATTGASRVVARRDPPHKSLATNVDDEGSSGGETEHGAVVAEVLRDGLVQPNGSPVVVYLSEDISRDTRTILRRQIGELGGEEALIKDEANVIVVPSRKFTTDLAVRTKQRGQFLKRVDWLTKLAEDRGDTDTDMYSQKPERARPSGKRWNPADYRNLADYLARVTPGDRDGGRQGTKLYRMLLDSTHLTMYRWAEGYTVEQLRLRYKTNRRAFDTEIQRIVRDHPEYLTSHVRRMIPLEDDIFGSWHRSQGVPRASTALTTPVYSRRAFNGKQREPGRSEGEESRVPFPIAVRGRPISTPGLTHGSYRGFNINQWNATIPQRQRNVSPVRFRLGNAWSAGEGTGRQRSLGTHRMPESVDKYRMPPPPLQLTGTTLVNLSQRMTQTTEDIPFASFAPTPLAVPPQDEFETVSVDFDTVGITEVTPTQRAPAVFSRYAPQPKESNRPNSPADDPTDVSPRFPHAQTDRTSRTVMTRHPASNAPTKTASPPDDDFERKREMLRAVGAVALSPERRRRRPPAAQGEPSFVAPQASSTAPQSRGSAAAASSASPRNRRSPSLVSAEDMAASRPWSVALSLATDASVTREEEAFLRKKGTQFGFRYEEVLELYLLAKGDLGLTVKNLQNLHEAAQVILEDEAEAKAKAEDMPEVVGPEEYDIDFVNNAVDARGSDGVSSGDGGARREEIDEAEEEILNSDLPPPNSLAKAYQLRQRRLSRRNV